jgi:amino acid adenylation domain-containing protein
MSGPSRTSLSHALSDAVAAHPDRPALSGSGRCLSYRELDALVERITAALRERIEPGDLVAVHLPKSIAAVATIHAVLRAGAAYVPVDARFPAHRAHTQITASRARAVVTTEDLAHSLDGIANPLRPARLVTDLGATHVPSWTGEVPPPSDSGRGPRADLAYVLYTSGSTGRPKGVAHTHSSAWAFIDWALREFAFAPDDVVLSLAPFHFDLSVLDLFVTARAGARLVLPPPLAAALPAALAKALLASGATTLYAVPTALRQLPASRPGRDLPTSALRRVIYAGEPFPATDLQKLRESLPTSARLYNLYGPTETNVVTHHKVTAQDTEAAAHSIPIGMACPYARLFLVEDDGTVAPLAPGREGQLGVAGASVMSGYWQDPTSTQEAFVTAAGGERIYRTGDAVRVNDDGQLVFLGRKDAMVKVNGYRIELGEIEQAILQVTGVREAAACTLALPGARRVAIVAFAVGKPTSSQLTRQCRELLPDYMCPSAILLLNALPTNANGKVDRQALADLAEAALRHDTTQPARDQLPRAQHLVDRILRGPNSSYPVHLGGTLDSFNTAAYLKAGTQNVQEVPQFQPDRFLQVTNLSDSDVSGLRVSVNGRRRWHTLGELLGTVLHERMTDREKAFALFGLLSREDVQAHNNYLRVDDFLPDESTAPSANQFHERANPIKALNCYYVSGCVLSAANLVILAREAGLPARVVMASPVAGPHDGHAGAEIEYDGSWHFFDPEARTFFLDVDNETVASYEQIHRNPALVIRTHAHGFAAPTCRGAFVRDYRTAFPPYEVPVERWLSTMEITLRPGESFTFRWDHRGKYRYGSNPRRTPDIPYRLANGLFTYQPDLSRPTLRNEIVAEQNTLQTIFPDLGPLICPRSPGQPSSITWKVTSPFPIVGARVGARISLPDNAEARVLVCSSTQPWQEAWSGGGPGLLDVDVDLDGCLAPVESPAIHDYYVQTLFSAADTQTMGLSFLRIDTDVQLSQTSLPALSVGHNDVLVESRDPSERTLLRVRQGWDESTAYCSPAPPHGPIHPADGATVTVAELRTLRWKPGTDDGELADHHVMVSTRQDFLYPIAPDLNRLTFTPQPVFEPARSFWRPGVTYYWRVRSRNRWGVWGDWSPAWTFVTAGQR